MAEPVYPVIKEKIEKAIRKGEWSDRLPSTFKLAKRFGASHLTVLKAIKMLKDDGKVIVKERQGTYIVKGDAARPFSPYVGVIGFSQDAGVPRHDLEYYYLQAIKNYLEAHGFRMLSIQHFDELDSHFAETLTEMRISGYLFTSSMLTQEVADQFKLKGIPFVSLNRIDKVNGIACADFDNAEGLRCLLRHYLACGHKRIGLARRQAPFLLNYSERNLQVYREVLESAKAYHPELLHIFDNDLIFKAPRDPQAADEIADDLFKQYYCCENPPTALHIDSVIIARSFLRKIRAEAPDWAASLALSTMAGSRSLDDELANDFCCTLTGDSSRTNRTCQKVCTICSIPAAPIRKIAVPVSLHIHRKVTSQDKKKKQAKQIVG